MRDRTHKLALPPSEIRHLIDKLAPTIAEVEKLRTNAAGARGAEAAARREIDQAVARDRQSAADALRGRQNPKKPSLPAAKKALDRASGEAEVLRQATADAERELAEAIAKHRAEYEHSLDAERKRATEVMRETATKLVAMEQERRQIRALADWLRTPIRYVPEKFPGRSLDLKGPGGDRYTLEEVFAAIVESLSAVETPSPEGAATVEAEVKGGIAA